MPQHDQQTTCILLVADAGDPRREMAREAIDERGWTTHEVNDPLVAMAELCLLDRTGTSRASWGLPADTGLVFVVLDPAAWPQSAEMIAAMKRYVPSAALWSYENGGLREISRAAQTSQPASAAAPAVNREPPTIESTFVSGEELAMLLGDQDQEEESPS